MLLVGGGNEPYKNSWQPRTLLAANATVRSHLNSENRFNPDPCTQQPFLWYTHTQIFIAEPAIQGPSITDLFIKHIIWVLEIIITVVIEYIYIYVSERAPAQSTQWIPTEYIIILICRLDEQAAMWRACACTQWHHSCGRKCLLFLGARSMDSQ